MIIWVGDVGGGEVYLGGDFAPPLRFGESARVCGGMGEGTIRSTGIRGGLEIGSILLLDLVAACIVTSCTFKTR